MFKIQNDLLPHDTITETTLKEKVKIMKNQIHTSIQQDILKEILKEMEKMISVEDSWEPDPNRFLSGSHMGLAPKKLFLTGHSLIAAVFISEDKGLKDEEDCLKVIREIARYLRYAIIDSFTNLILIMIAFIHDESLYNKLLPRFFDQDFTLGEYMLRVIHYGPSPNMEQIKNELSVVVDPDQKTMGGRYFSPFGTDEVIDIIRSKCERRDLKDTFDLIRDSLKECRNSEDAAAILRGKLDAWATNEIKKARG
ncbi:MAG: hypothetical protein AB1742_01330 [bacterium]